MRQHVFKVLMIFICVVWVVRPAEGFIIESPKEGSTLVLGEPFQWKIRLEPGEVCETINEGHPPFNSSTGLYEWTDTIEPGDNTLGKESFLITGAPETCEDAEVTLNVVLPPTTVLTEINAAISNGREQGFMTLYKHDNGNLILTSDSFKEVTAGGLYSDGVWREITGYPDTTYTSSDEKVLKVTPPGKWTLNDKSPTLSKKAEKERPGDEALVTAVGPGRAKIIVRNGPFEASVVGIVNIKPCSAWKKEAFEFELPVCD